MFATQIAVMRWCIQNYIPARKKTWNSAKNEWNILGHPKQYPFNVQFAREMTSISFVDTLRDYHFKWLVVMGEIDGPGDEIFALRALPILLDKYPALKVRWICQNYNQAKDLYKHSFQHYNDRVKFIDKSASLLSSDGQIIESYRLVVYVLKNHLKDVLERKNDVFLSCDTSKLVEQKRNEVANKITENPLRKIGFSLLSYVNKKSSEGLDDKSLDIEKFKSMIIDKLPLYHFVSLQYHRKDLEPNVYNAQKTDFNKEFQSYNNSRVTILESVNFFDLQNDNTAVIDCCDIILTNSTSIAHLAGAMGKGVILGLHGSKVQEHWKLQKILDWYPNMEIVIAETDDAILSEMFDILYRYSWLQGCYM